PITYSLTGTDAAKFNINASSGVVTLKAVADFQTQPAYSFIVNASDGTLTSTEAVTVSVVDVAPTIASAPASTPVTDQPPTPTAPAPPHTSTPPLHDALPISDHLFADRHRRRQVQYQRLQRRRHPEGGRRLPDPAGLQFHRQRQRRHLDLNRGRHRLRRRRRA